MIYNCFYTCTVVATPYNIDKPLIRARPIIPTSTSSRPCLFLRLLAAVVDAFLRCDGTLLKPVIFKCKWFDPRVSKRSPKFGIVEIRQDSFYLGEDVFIVAQQARQVYYCPYACKTDPHLQGWYIVHKVSPHGKCSRPNDDDYNLNPPTDDEEFYQQDEGLLGMLEIDLTEDIEMEVDEEWVVEEEAADEVHDPRDLKMLDGLQLDNDSDENEAVDDLEALDSDDETYRPYNPDHEEY
jgi:hypothetical protein